MKPTATFDGQNLIIQLPSLGDYSSEIDLYSAWKRWVRLGDNTKFLPAFETTGGDPIGGGQEIEPYYFLRNDLGWRIRAPEADGQVVINGNLFPRDSTQDIFLQATGFDSFIRQIVSNRSVLSNAGLTPEQELDLRRIKLNTSLIPATV